MSQFQTSSLTHLYPRYFVGFISIAKTSDIAADASSRLVACRIGCLDLKLLCFCFDVCCCRNYFVLFEFFFIYFETYGLFQWDWKDRQNKWTRWDVIKSPHILLLLWGSSRLADWFREAGCFLFVCAGFCIMYFSCLDFLLSIFQEPKKKAHLVFKDYALSN